MDWGKLGSWGGGVTFEPKLILLLYLLHEVLLYKSNTKVGGVVHFTLVCTFYRTVPGLNCSDCVKFVYNFI